MSLAERRASSCRSADASERHTGCAIKDIQGDDRLQSYVQQRAEPAEPELCGGSTEPKMGRRNQFGVDARGMAVPSGDLGPDSRSVIGWAVNNRMTRDIVIWVLKMAVALWQPPIGCIHHTGRSSQYCSHDYLSFCASMGSEWP